MLRGAIDFTSPDRIGGWIHAELGPVQGRTILAFLDGKCVGAGVVDRFRQDLADAGLGDGHLGFNFGITVENPHDIERVTVKLEGSDLALVQPMARITRGTPVFARPPSLLLSPAKIEWMRVRGWLEQSELDFVKSLSQIGVYDLSLRRSKNAEKVAGTPLIDPAQGAQQMLSLIALQDIHVASQEISDTADLTQIANLSRAGDPVVALWSPRRDSVIVVEGSNSDTGDLEGRSLDGAIEHFCGPDRLLFLDLRCSFGLATNIANRKLMAFSVSP